MGMRKTLNVWKGKRISQQRCYIRKGKEEEKRQEEDAVEVAKKGGS